MPSPQKPKSKPKAQPKERHFLMVAIDPKLRAKFAKYAAKQGMNMSSIIRGIIERTV